MRNILLMYFLLFSITTNAQNGVMVKTIEKVIGEYKNKNGKVVFTRKTFKNANNDTLISILIDVSFKPKKLILASLSAYLIINSYEVPKILDGLKQISKIVKNTSGEKESLSMVTEQYKVITAKYFAKGENKYMATGWFISVKEVYRLDMSTKSNQEIIIYEEDIDQFISLLEQSIK